MEKEHRALLAGATRGDSTVSLQSSEKKRPMCDEPQNLNETESKTCFRYQFSSIPNPILFFYTKFFPIPTLFFYTKFF